MGRSAIRTDSAVNLTALKFGCNRLCIPLLAGIVLIVLGQVEAGAAVINAASVSLADVTAAVALANDGDTVVIPAGTASWTQTLTITNGITLQGQTTISGDHTTTMTANDQTIILDDIPRGGLCQLVLDQHTSGTCRVTGITFRNGALTSYSDSGSIMSWCYPPAYFRVDHCHLQGLHNDFLGLTGGQVYGVCDHNIFDMGLAGRGFVFTMANWGGHSYGDGAWAAPTDFGGPTFFFVEDCTINNSIAAAQTVGGTDSYGGGKFVIRYSTFINCVVTDHGTESSGRLRSVRAKEIYNNTFLFNRFSGSGGLQRGGCALIHDNTYTYVPPGWITGITLTNFRSFDRFLAFGTGNGNDAWDLNSDTADHTGNGLGGGVNGLFSSGTTITGTVNGSITVAGTPWTTNQWVGYTLTNTTSNPNKASYIISNTANTITYWFLIYDPNEPLGNVPFTTGDAFAIYKLPTACLDQCGRGQGNLIGGDVPTPHAWPSEALEPVYSWNNTLNGSNVNLNANTPTIIEGRDFYNNTPMPGYTPYTYPHPLVSGGPGPQAPGDLHIMP
jgi:hypothetical protein